MESRPGAERACRAGIRFVALLAAFLTASPVVPQEPLARVNVDLVQVEVVVTDSKGNRVSNLEAEEMRVSENGQPRRITHFSFIPEASREARPSAAAAPSMRGPVPPPAAAVKPITPPETGRVMAIVVDDLGMDHESFAAVRRALEGLLEREIQPGDLTALITTSGRSGGFARLTDDGRLLRAALERFRSLPTRRTGVRERGCEPPSSYGAKFADDAEEVAQAYYSQLTLTALGRVVEGLRGLPGRKSILLFSEGGLRTIRGYGFGEIDRIVMDQYQAFLAHANRAGVSVNTIDPRGLMATALTSEDTAATDRCVEAKRMELVHTQQQLAEIAQRTAGIAVTDDNDLSAAMTRVMREQSGYYLVAWRPSEEPLAKRVKGSPPVRNISIRLKRPGLKARFHSSLYAEEPPDPSQADSARRLADAMLSPFGAPDIRVRVSSRFWDAGTAAGPVLDTDLRIDPRDCTFVESAGRRQAEIHLIAAIWGTEEKPLDTFERSYTVSLAPAAYERALSEGLVQRMQMKVKRPGAYQIRAAVLDRQANRLGSASDFVEVPDLKRGKLALSGIALTSSDGAEEGTRLRYRRGETVSYTVQILNATAGVEVRAALYRGDRQLGASEPMTVDGRGQADPRRWIAGDSFRLGKQLPPGDYTLQLTGTDRAAQASPATAVQLADFEVVE